MSNVQDVLFISSIMYSYMRKWFVVAIETATSYSHPQTERAHDIDPMKYFILKIFLTLRSTSDFHLDTSYAMALWRVRDAHHIETNYIFYSQHTAPAVFVPLLTGKWLGHYRLAGVRNEKNMSASSPWHKSSANFYHFLFQFRSQEICSFHSEKVY